MALWFSPAAAATPGNPAVATLAAKSGGGPALPDDAAAAAAAAANIPEAEAAELNGWLSCFMGDGPGLAEASGVEAGGGSGSLW